MIFQCSNYGTLYPVTAEIYQFSHWCCVDYSFFRQPKKTERCDDPELNTVSVGVIT